MDLLCMRVESLDSPGWFLVWVRPQGYPLSAPVGYPDLPFCIIAVATFAETETIFYSHVWWRQEYRDAFQLPAAPEGEALPAPGFKKGHVDGSPTERVVEVTCDRKSDYFFRSAFACASSGVTVAMACVCNR